MRRLIAFLSIVFFSTSFVSSQIQPIEKPKKGYRFQHRIKGPEYKKSRILELMVDEYGNYLVATYRGEKSSFIYLYVYNLYTWEEKYKIKMDDNRCELYNSTFDASGDYFFLNYDIFRNKFKSIDLRTGEIQKVDCSATPKGCKKIEPQFYKVDAYTIGNNYYIYRDPKFVNYIKIMVKKEMYIPKGEGVEINGPLNPKIGGVIQLSPQQIRDLKAGQELVHRGVNMFFDPNAIDENGNKTEYVPEEGNYKIRLTQIEMDKLKQKTSFLCDKFVVKLDITAYEKEKAEKSREQKKQE